MSLLHVYRPYGPMPATDWQDVSFDPPYRTQWAAHKVLRCEDCWRKRRAKNCVVFVSYGWLRVRCADDAACKTWSKADRRRKRIARLAWKAAQ